MKSLHSPVRSYAGSLEPLEARIAPAVILVGNLNQPGTDTDYNEAPFVNTNTSTDAISTALHTHAVGGFDETFYLSLKAGDEVRIFTVNEFGSFIKVTAGRAIAFFEDLNHNNVVESGELVSLSLSAGASVQVQNGGNLVGDVVTNLDASAFVSNSYLIKPGATPLHMSDLVSGKQTIVAFSEQGGDIAGNVLTGGSASNLNLKGVTGVFTGTAAIGKTFDHFPGAAFDFGNGIVSSLSPTADPSNPTVDSLLPGVLQPGASITNLVTTAVTTIAAGTGGAGGAGGSITNVQVIQDVNGFTLQAGTGGAADASLHVLNGGAGGNVSRIYVTGFTDTTLNDVISIRGGTGGLAATGLGGHGGNVSSVYVGYELKGTLPTVSIDFLADNVSIMGGAGGAGKSGGAGGALTNMNVLTNTLQDVLLATKGLAAEIVLQGGQGGNALDTTSTVPGLSHAGAGGSVLTVAVADQAVQLTPGQVIPVGQPMDDAAIRVIAGNAGTVANAQLSAGAAGGNVTTVNLLGSHLTVTAGTGSEGTTGGAGGSLVGMKIRQALGVYAHTVDYNAGSGGHGTRGAGGAGGSINSLISDDGDFTRLGINNNGGGAGGNSDNGFGGRGGSVTNLDLLDSDSLITRPDLTPLSGTLVVNAGRGGDGKLGGGAGGALQAARFEAINLTATINSGRGGNGGYNNLGVMSGLANGGAGGAITGLQMILALDTDTGLLPARDPIAVASATVMSGAGGKGTRTGGAGGSETADNINVGGRASLIAGNGGDGGTAAPGAGGSILLSGVFALNGDGIMMAGNAGGAVDVAVAVANSQPVGGSLPAAGGSIKGVSADDLTGIYAATSLRIQAGDGHLGGAGGTIAFVGYGSTNASLNPTPRGDIMVQAGNGSVLGKALFGASTAYKGLDYAGAGGSIINLSGSVSSLTAAGAMTQTVIAAGHGGGAAGVAKSGAGGSITTLRLERGPAASSAESVVQNALTGQLIQLSSTPSANVTITAGDGGGAGGSAAAATVPIGANGGSINNVTILNIGDTAVLRSISGGDAGPGKIKGGVGGSVTQVQALAHDIGVRSGQAYGYTTMGGIFAGLGGAGPTTAATGQAGNVSMISAESISSIAAGKTTTPQLANTVSNIRLGHGHTLDPLSGITLNNSSYFTLTFHPTGGGAETTVPLPGNASLADVRDAINNLSSIPAGGVDVIVGPNSSSTFQITFKANGMSGYFTADRTIEDVTTRVAGTSATPEVQTISVLGVGPVTFNVGGTQVVQPAHATPAAVQTALNTELMSQGQTPVTVTAGPDGSYRVQFNGNGAMSFITASETVPLQAKQVMPGSATTPEVDALNFPLLRGANDLVLVVNGTTVTVPAQNSMAPTAQQVQTALQTAVPGNQVTVVLNPNNTYDISFQSAPPTIVAAESLPASVTRLSTGGGGVAEVQQVSLAHGTDASQPSTFTLTVDGHTTAALPAFAAPSVVMDALTAAGATNVTVTDGAGGVYTLTYTDGTSHALAAVTDTQPVTVTVTQTNPNMVQLSYDRQITFNPVDYAAANLVGAIAHYNTLGADRFEYLDVNGNGTFNLGDTAVDGLIAAKNFSQRTVNFTPQARLIVNSDQLGTGPGIYKPVNPADPTTPVFFDFDNTL